MKKNGDYFFKTLLALIISIILMKIVLRKFQLAINLWSLEMMKKET